MIEPLTRQQKLRAKTLCGDKRVVSRKDNASVNLVPEHQRPHVIIQRGHPGHCAKGRHSSIPSAQTMNKVETSCLYDFQVGKFHGHTPPSYVAQEDGLLDLEAGKVAQQNGELKGERRPWSFRTQIFVGGFVFSFGTTTLGVAGVVGAYRLIVILVIVIVVIVIVVVVAVAVVVFDKQTEFGL